MLKIRCEKCSATADFHIVDEVKGFPAEYTGYHYKTIQAAEKQLRIIEKHLRITEKENEQKNISCSN